MPLPGDRAWRTCWNTSVLCTFISALIGEIRSRSTSNALTRAARSARKSIRGTTWWGWGIRRIRRRRISRTNGKPRVFQPTCIQGRHGKAALNPKDRLLPSRQRLRNRLLKRTLLLLRRLPLRLRLQLLPGSRRRLPVSRPANQARSQRDLAFSQADHSAAPVFETAAPQDAEVCFNAFADNRLWLRP